MVNKIKFILALLFKISPEKGESARAIFLFFTFVSNFSRIHLAFCAWREFYRLGFEALG
jgi:hypothetical protein